MAPRRRCPICSSKQWHKEPSSGLVVCSEGHVLQNYRNETSQMDEMGPHSVRKRAFKSTRQKKEKTSKANPKLYHGDRGRFHYFQCLQLLLRKQIATLTKLWKLPPEFEIVCRDIWALHLGLLPVPPPAEPYYYQPEASGDADNIAKPPRNPEKEMNHDEPINPPSINDDTAGEEHPDTSSSESSSSDEETDEGDLTMADLLRENSESESESEDDEGGAEPLAPKPAPSEAWSKRRKGRPNRYELPAGNIAILILACWTMRVPVVYRDFSRLIDTYELPYLDPVRLLPTTLTLHLTKHTIQSLSPHHAPSTMVLHTLTSRLAKLANSKFGVYTPELNAAPVLWRVVRSLGGTPSLYILTKRLAHILSLPLTLHYSLAPHLQKLLARDSEHHKFDNVPAELSLMATAIIVLKMVYGLDGKTRSPVNVDEAATVMPELDSFLHLLRTMESAENQTDEAIFSAQTPMSVVELSENMLDGYMDFCEGALLGPSDRELDGVLSEYFPLSRTSSRVPPAIVKFADETEDLPKLLSATSIAHEPDNQSTLRPGQSYSIYNSRDVLGSFPEDYEIFIRRGAQWVGVEEKYLNSVIERFERRIVRWWENVKRRSREEKTKKK